MFRTSHIASTLPRTEQRNMGWQVTYEGRWKDGFVCGHGSLTMPDGTKKVRAWPAQSR